MLPPESAYLSQNVGITKWEIPVVSDVFDKNSKGTRFTVKMQDLSKNMHVM